MCSMVWIIVQEYHFNNIRMYTWRHDWAYLVSTTLLSVKSLPFIILEKSPNFSHNIGNQWKKCDFTVRLIYMWERDCSAHVILQPFPSDRIQLYSMIYYWHYKNEKYSEFVIAMKSISTEYDVWLKKKPILLFLIPVPHYYNRVLHHRDLDIVQTKLMSGSAETYISVKQLNVVTNI